MTITVRFMPEFIRSYSRLEKDLQIEVEEKIGLFKKCSNHTRLKVHKLHGRLNGSLSFSVNYKYRVVFEYADSKTIILKTVGDHDIYK